MKKNQSEKKHRSAAARLALRFSLLLAVLILVLTVAIVMLLKSEVRIQQNRELTSAMEQIASTVATGYQSDDSDEGDMILGEGLPYYIVFTVFKTDTGDIIETNDPFLPQLPLTSGKSVFYREKNYFIDGDLNILYCAKKYTGESSGDFTVQTALNMDRDTPEELIERLPKTLLIILLPLLFISFWAALLITRRTLKPVEQMTETARKIGSANLDQRLPVSGRNDEIDTLAVTFNDLFARLQEDFENERQFTSNVSHELKTPLAVILGQANLIRRWGKNDPVQLEKSLNALIAESQTMETVVTNMLQLSRLECGTVKPAPQPIMLMPLLERLADDTHTWSPGTSFDFTGVSPTSELTADPEFMYQCFTILVSNSVKFAGTNAHITVAGTQDGAVFRITFSDDGPGFSEESLPHVFERFYRGDTSHNRNAGGAGLGLAIAKVLMTMMHGTIRAANTLPHGAEITLELYNEK